MNEPEISMSIEETNKLRAQLGLKPLKEEQNRKEEPTILEKSNDRIENNFSTEDWLSKMAKTSKKVDNNFELNDQLDYKIGHDFEDLKTGENIVTLKDSDEMILEEQGIKDLDHIKKQKDVFQNYTGTRDSEKSLLYQYENQTGFRIGDPVKRKREELLGETVSTQIEKTEQSEFRPVKKFKKANIRTIEKDIGEQIMNEIEIKNIKPNINQVIASVRPNIELDLNRLKASNDITVEGEEFNEATIITSIVKPEEKEEKCEFTDATMEEAAEEEMDIDDAPSVDNDYLNNIPNTKYFDLPSFSVAPFLPQIVKVFDEAQFDSEMKHIDAEIDILKIKRKNSKRKKDMNPIDKKIDQLEKQRASLLIQKMKHYKPNIDIQYVDKNRVLTPKEAFKKIKFYGQKVKAANK
eukprot:NODE_15_length_50561_cov_0.608081.p12 type:complete len:408 gc:universal NODE_15_length_50561_cov_0.608081:25730-26953(+)